MSQDMTRWAAECYAILENGIRWKTVVSEEESFVWAKTTQRHIKSAAKFLMPEDSWQLLTRNHQFQELITSGHKMPYKTVCIACSDQEERGSVSRLILVKSDFSEKDPTDKESLIFNVNLFYRLEGEWNLAPFLWDYNFYGENRVWDMLSEEVKRTVNKKTWDDTAHGLTKVVQQAIGSLMLLLSCSNVSERDIPISKLKRDRLKKKKLPVFEHKTLYIEDVRSARVDRGGTSSPKRQHHRRGHIRRLSNGNQVWVRPCLVGDPSLGFVSKDYVLRGGKH